MFRISGGENKGAKLLLPPSDMTRPTSNRAREALFNCLFSMDVSLRDAYILDGFAGSGAIGLECLSRGASHCVFVEKYPVVQKILCQNIAKIHKEAKARVVETFEDGVKTLKKSFDFIYLDPPYDLLNPQGEPLYCDAIRILLPYITSDAVIVIETRCTEGDLSLKDIPLFVHAHKTYGMVRLWFLKKESLS